MKTSQKNQPSKPVVVKLDPKAVGLGAVGLLYNKV